jgi:hypothetical protein
MLDTLATLKYVQASRIKEEPISDKPGYSKLIKWYEPIEWDEAKWGKIPRPPSLSSILSKLQNEEEANKNNKDKTESEPKSKSAV